MRSVGRAYRPTRTYQGRVVYDRKKHPFRQADLNRIARSIFFQAGPNETIITRLLYEISVYFVRILLDLFIAGTWAPIAYKWLYGMVDFFLGQVGSLINWEASSNYARGFYSYLVGRYPELVPPPPETTA
jgi:hypothetical protein